MILCKEFLLSEDRFVEHFAAFISGIWQIHPFREGNTRTVALFAIKYLRSRGYSVTNDLFAEKSWYFRNALVRANYENDRLGVEKTQLPLEEFFKVLIYGDEIELHNRFLRIGQEYGTTTAKAIVDLHRHDDVVNRPDVGINRRNDGINDGINSSNDVINDVINGVIKFTEKEEIAVKALVRDPRLSAARLADLIGVKQRQAQRIITSLKNKAGLKRRGARKNGGSLNISAYADPIDAKAQLLVNGGSVLAVGTSGTIKNFSGESGQSFIACSLNGSGSDTVAVKSADGGELASLVAAYGFNTVLFSAPILSAGGEYTVSSGTGSSTAVA